MRITDQHVEEALFLAFFQDKSIKHKERAYVALDMWVRLPIFHEPTFKNRYRGKSVSKVR